MLVPRPLSRIQRLSTYHVVALGPHARLDNEDDRVLRLVYGVVEVALLKAYVFLGWYALVVSGGRDALIPREVH